jgi:hypothetical protein
MGYGFSIWYTVYRYVYLPYRYGHPGYRYGISADDMGDDSIDTVILDIDMGYLVTLPGLTDNDHVPRVPGHVVGPATVPVLATRHAGPQPQEVGQILEQQRTVAADAHPLETDG